MKNNCSASEQADLYKIKQVNIGYLVVWYFFNYIKIMKWNEQEMNSIIIL